MCPHAVYNMMDRDVDDALYTQQADLCAVFSNPRRLRLLDELTDCGECTVSELQAATDIPQSTISRQLRRMRDLGVVTKRTEGARSYYQLADQRIAESMQLMRAVLLDQLDRSDDGVSS